MRVFCQSNYFAALAALLVAAVTGSLTAQESGQKSTHEPVFRVPKVANSGQPTSPQEGPVARTASVSGAAMLNAKPAAVKPAASTAKAPHPLDRAIQIAQDGLINMRENIQDYTAIMVKRERVDNQLGDPEYMRVKIRNPRNIDGREVPFSVYMKFLKPRAAAGREVIWVDGENENQIIAHEGGLLGVKRFHLDPAGWIAMKGQRYPIYEAGLENLVIKLIEKAERDRAAGMCEVNYVEGAKINGRECTLIEVIHPERVHPFEFYKAKVYIDDELNIPVRYAAYDWPTTPGGKPVLIEEYTYINVELNVGLTDLDFDPNNPAYKFPAR